MLKFRFKRKEMRRRSNSCPNLDSCTAESDAQNERTKKMAKHTSYYLDEKSGPESETEDGGPSPSRKERLQAQKSIRRVKKKEKEQQENAEKNLLSVDDFWRKLDSLKAWLHEEVKQGKEEVEKMQSPKLRSHFKKFIRLWNKRKLPLKYYRHCCVDAEENSSNSENPKPQSPSDGQNTVDFFPHNTLRDLPSYHHFPFLDDHVDQIASVFSTPGSADTEPDSKDDESPFATFGKWPGGPHASTSFLARQVNLRASQRLDSRSKTKSSHLSSSSSPKKFATISRATPASSIFKSHNSSSPQIHAVGSPTCPCPPQFVFPKPVTEISAEHSPTSPEHKGSAKKPSPAYMSVRDAIPFACNSPKYWQVDDAVFDFESDYCSLSPYSAEKNRPQMNSSRISKASSNLNRRRSKSMEDIYAVPSRLMTMEKFEPLSRDEVRLKTPPIPAKKFTQTPSMVNLGVGRKSPNVRTTSNDTLTSEMVSGSENGLVASSDFSSLNSVSTDLGYQSCKHEELSGGSERNAFIGSSFYPNTEKFSFRSHQDKVAVKRRSEEHEIVGDGFESFKKTKSDSSHQGDNNTNDNGDDDDRDRSSMSTLTSTTETKTVVDENMDLSVTDSLKQPPTPVDNDNSETMKSSENRYLTKKITPKFSILTGSTKPTTRSPKTVQDVSKPQRKSNKKVKADTDKDESRLSLLQIKVLDTSPTFPRRRVKRRSSNLSVTPGKSLTFGNKSSPHHRVATATSSPRRVSFAKNAKNGDENATPLRQRTSTSTSKTSTRGGVASRDISISRQSQDKASFESFWTRHEPSSKSKSQTQERNSSKPWSPSKWLSPSKAVQMPPKVADSVTNPNSTEDSVVPTVQDEKKGSLVKSLSPKKLFSSLQRNSSSSLSLLNVSTSSVSPSGGEIPNKELNSATFDPKPKSILKSKNTIQDPVTRSNDSGNKETLFPAQTYSDKSLQSSQTRGLHLDLFPNVSKEADMNLCRSPPRLGVASLVPKSPVLSHGKLSSFDARLKQNLIPSSLSGNQGFDRWAKSKAFTLPQTKNAQFPVTADVGGKGKPDFEGCAQQIHGRTGGTQQENKFYSGSKSCEDVANWRTTSSRQGELNNDFRNNIGSRDELNDLPNSGSRDGLFIQTNGSIRKTFNFNDIKQVRKGEAVVDSCVTQTRSQSATNSRPLFVNPTSTSVMDDHGNCTDSIGDDESRTCPDKQFTDWSNDTNDSSTNEIVSAYSDDLSSNFNAPQISSELKSKDKFFSNPLLLKVDNDSDRSAHVQQGIGNNEKELQPACLNSYVSKTPDYHGTAVEESHDVRSYNSSIGNAGSSSAISETQNVADVKKDGEISKNLLERIKSFRASPKVEENDGWITERRRSKAGKPKSFRSAHNRYLLRSGSQDDSDVEMVPEKEASETCIETDHSHGAGVPGTTRNVGEKSNVVTPVYDDTMTHVYATMTHVYATMTPVYEIARPVYDTETPVYDLAAPLYDTETPVYDLAAPVYDSMTPAYDTPISGSSDLASGNLDKLGQMLSNVNTDILKEGVVATEGGHADRGYETESGSRDEKWIGGAEGESVSSSASFDSGTGKYVPVPPCPIYDVPRNGVHAAGIGNTEVQSFPSPKDSTEAEISISERSPPFDSIEGRNGWYDATIPDVNPTAAYTVVEKTGFSVSKEKSSDVLSNEDQQDKENKQILAKSVKPRPLVKPKPKPNAKVGQTLTSSSSFSTKAWNGQTPSSPKSAVKRRSSVLKQGSALGHRPSVSTSYKSNNDNNTTRPVVRKRSSVATKEDLRKKSFKNTSNVSVTIAQSQANTADNKSDKNVKRESVTPRKKRTSLERGRRPSGASGPEKNSFAQRRKFFQQLQASPTPSRADTATQSVAKVPSFLRTTESFLSKSRPHLAPKPVIKPKP